MTCLLGRMATDAGRDGREANHCEDWRSARTQVPAGLNANLNRRVESFLKASVHESQPDMNLGLREEFRGAFQQEFGGR
jgi:hypothetical protein